MQEELCMEFDDDSKARLFGARLQQEFAIEMADMDIEDGDLCMDIAKAEDLIGHIDDKISEYNDIQTRIFEGRVGINGEFEMR